MSLGQRLVRLFVEPVSEEPAAPVSPEPVRWLPPAVAPAPASSHAAGASFLRVAVVCDPADARVAGGAVALGLAHGAGGPAVLLEWTGREAAGGSDRASSAGARRLAVSLRETGEAASAAGRIVRVALPADEGEAIASSRLVERAAGHAPGVLLVAGPRGPGLDTLLTDCSLILLAVRPGTDAGIADLALDELVALGRPADRLDLPASPGAAALARSGTALVAPLRGPVLGLLGAG